MMSSSCLEHSDNLRMFYDVQGEDTMFVDLYLYFYTIYFIFIAWSYDQSINFTINDGVKMEGY